MLLTVGRLTLAAITLGTGLEYNGTSNSTRRSAQLPGQIEKIQMPMLSRSLDLRRPKAFPRRAQQLKATSGTNWLIKHTVLRIRTTMMIIINWRLKLHHRPRSKMCFYIPYQPVGEAACVRCSDTQKYAGSLSSIGNSGVSIAVSTGGENEVSTAPISRTHIWLLYKTTEICTTLYWVGKRMQ